MATQESVVTPQRFSEGFTYPDYFAQIKVNRDKFEQFYQFRVKPEDAARLQAVKQKANGPKKMMVLGEDWCPDVFRGMPTLARLAEAGGFEMRIFPRDSHLDIMDEFLKEGQWASIPTAVFYTADHEYICHWIERPVVAEQEILAISAKLREENPDMTDQEVLTARRPLIMDRYPAWQQDSIDEIVDLLEKRVGN